MCRLSLVCLCLLTSLVLAQPLERDLLHEHAEAMLVKAGIKTDPQGLLDFFRRNTHSKESRAEIQRLILQLGDEEFAVRERASTKLIALGRPALLYLRTALKHPDAEIARRSRLCVQQIETTLVPTLLTAAAQLLSEVNPPGSLETLLDYLPSCDDYEVERSIFDSLKKVAQTSVKPSPILMEYLEAEFPIQRAAAAHLLAQTRGDQIVSALLPLLEDTDPRPRLEAAKALLHHRDGRGIPTLILLLEDVAFPLAWSVEETLLAIALDTAPNQSLGDGSREDRTSAKEAWQKWWKENGKSLDLTEFGKRPPLLGLTLVTEYDGTSDGGRISEWGKDGKLRWSFGSLRGVNDVQRLPGKRVLIAERNASLISERDREGKILWQYKTEGSAIGCFRLSNGNTLVTTYDKVAEVTRDGREVQSHNNPARYRYSHVKPNGHVLCIAANGEIEELDRDLKVIRTIKPADYINGAGYWASVEPLKAGRFLVTLGSSGKVVEIDGTGKILWECTVSQPVYAHRLQNGNTLISLFESKCLVEINRAGKEVSRLKLDGRPFSFRRY